IIPLEFNEGLAEEFGLQRGRRLLAVNTYMSMEHRELGEDLKWGDRHTNLWGNACPLIAEFLSDDVDQIEQRKRQFSTERWQRTAELANEWRRGPGPRPRDGRPLLCRVSRALLEPK